MKRLEAEQSATGAAETGSVESEHQGEEKHSKKKDGCRATPLS